MDFSVLLGYLNAAASGAVAGISVMALAVFSVDVVKTAYYEIMSMLDRGSDRDDSRGS
ncbi:hypothetical protein [Aquitalea aquatilis]|uniref:hypothetical protein n=1 Tax=Aquitalea aquatilis TaxID=1537400 RepID=UPI00143CC866|nr:hypothetical protein [Aquitalea aquatilis]